jgi:Mg-chelatase subunit ChlD
VVGFRDLATEVTELGADRKTTIAKVCDLLPRGGTNIAAGIRRSIDMMTEPDRRGSREPSPDKENNKQVILLTDGDATHPKPKQFAAEYAKKVTKLAAKKSITVSVVCIGKENIDQTVNGTWELPNLELARQLSEVGGGSFFFVQDVKDLSGIFISEIDKLMINLETQIPISHP